MVVLGLNFWIIRDNTSLDGHEEGDPLVVGGVGGVILALHPLELHDTLHVGLVLGRDVGRAVYPAKVLRQVRVDALELTTEKRLLIIMI